MSDGLSAPAPFLWGVATSAYQCEGGYNGPGQPRTNWADAEEAGEVAPCGDAVNFWQRYEEDFARCRAMGLRAFRLGIEWSRVQPSSAADVTAPPAYDLAALDHYARMLAACRAHGMEPVVTLHHFVHPAWLGSDPWLEEKTPALFAEYVTFAVAYLNRALLREHQSPPLRYFITINEPNMLVLNTYAGNQFPARGHRGLSNVTTALNQLLIAHIRSYNALHELYAQEGWPAPLATFNNYCSDLYWSDKGLLDLVASRERGVPREKLTDYLERQVTMFEGAFEEARLPLKKDISYLFGYLAKQISDRLGRWWFRPERFAPLLDAIEASPRARLFDYVGLDYYDPFAAHNFRLPVFWDHEFKSKTFRAWIINSITSKWWDWRVLPRGLHFFCALYARDYNRPVLIAENGMAHRRRRDNAASPRRDRMDRSSFLRAHTAEVRRLLEEGVPVIGYLHWSLFDNYEWGSYTPRFGLFSLDYTHNLERLEEDHYGDRPSRTYAAIIRESEPASGDPNLLL